MSLTRIGSIGINTGIAFAGVTTIVTLNTANDALSIGATVNVGSGITLGASGDIFATGVCTATSFSGSGANLTGIDTDLVSDTSPQLGGNLDVNTKNIVFGDSSDGSSDDVLTFGAGTDLKIYHSGDQNYVSVVGDGNLNLTGATSVVIKTATNKDAVVCNNAGSTDLYHNNSKKFETISAGVRVTGNMSIADGSTSSGKVALGTGDDLNLYHNGTDSYVENKTGDLYLSTTNSGDDIILYSLDDIQLQVQSGEDAIKCIGNGAVELYHDNSRRLQTFDLGIDIGLSATGNFGIRWGGDNFNYANIWTEYGSGDIFIAGGLKQKGTNGGFFSSYTGNFSRNAIQIDAFGNSGIHFHTSAAQNVTKDDAITVPERLRIEEDGDLRISSDDVGTNYGFIDGWNGAAGNLIIGADQSATGNASSSDGSAIIFRTRGGERARIQHLGGISFNGDDAQANALDDYEEGTYTITALNDGGATLTSNRANYTKIGNTVRLSGSFTITATNGTNNNQARFSIPFSSSISSYYVAHGNVVTNTTYSGSVLSATIENSGTFMLFNPSTGMAGQTWSQLGLNSRFDFDVVYRV